MAVENTKAFLAATYSGGTTLALWGVVEIFLRIDPFVVVCFKHLLVVGIAILSVGTGGILARWLLPPPALPGTRRRAAYGLAFLSGLGLVLLVSLFLAPVYTEACADAVTPLGADVLFLVPAAALLFTYLAAAAVRRLHEDRLRAETARILRARRQVEARGERYSPPPDRLRGRFPAWFDVPLLAPVFVTGLFIVSISLGRSEEIRRADVAQEELRQAGLSFSMASLQSAIFFNAPRSVELFREAGVDIDDINLALGTGTELNPDTPLLTDVMARIAESERACKDIGTEACRRTGNFLAMFGPDTPVPLTTMFREAFTRRFGDGGETAEVEFVCEKVRDAIRLADEVRDGTPPRSVLSHALMDGRTAIAVALIERCQRTDPLADLRATVADRRIVEDPAQMARLEAEFAQRQRFHILATLDPHLALGDVSEPEAANGIDVPLLTTALCDADVKATGLLGFEPQSYVPDDCRADLQTGDDVTVRILDVELGGGGGCSAALAEVHMERVLDHPYARLEIQEAKMLSLYRLDDGGALKGVVQRRGEQTRLILRRTGGDESSDEVSALGWDDDAMLKESESTLWVASDHEPNVTRDASGTRRTVYVVSTDFPDWQDPLPADVRAAQEGEESEDKAKREPRQTLHLTNAHGGPLLRQEVTLDEALGLRILPGAAPGCLLIERVDGGGNATVAFGGDTFAGGLSPRLQEGRYVLTAAAIHGTDTLDKLVLETLHRVPCLPQGRTSSTFKIPVGETLREDVTVPAGARSLVCDMTFESPLELHVSAGSGTDITLDLQDAEGTSLLDFLIDGGDPETLDRNLDAGRYRLVVAPYGEEVFDGKQPLDMTIEARAPLPEVADLRGCRPVEAENEEGTARLLDPGPIEPVEEGDAHRLVPGRISVQELPLDSAPGVACAFDLDADAEVRVEAMTESSEDIVVQVYSSDGTEMLSNGDDDWGHPEVGGGERFDLELMAGTYRFVVAPYSESEFTSPLMTVGIGARAL